jgi:hypothetical protein
LGTVVQFCASAGDCWVRVGGFLHGGDHVVQAGGFFLFELGRGGDFVDDEDGGAEAGGGGGFWIGEDGAEGFEGEIGQLDGAVAVEEGTVVAGDG